MNCTPLVIQYGMLDSKWGIFMSRGVPNKRYMPEFEEQVIKTMLEERLSYNETCRRFEVNS